MKLGARTKTPARFIRTDSGDIDSRVADIVWRAVPFIGFGGVWITGTIPHLIFNGSFLWAGLGVFSTFMAAIVAMVTARGRLLRRVLKIATTLFIGLWLSGAIAFGVGGMMSQLMLAGIMTLGPLHMLTMGRHDEDDTGDPLIFNFNKVKEKWGLEGSRIRKVMPGKNSERNEYKDQYLVVGDRTQHTSDDFTSLSGRFASLMRTSKDKIIISPDRNDNGKAHIEYINGNIEHEDLPWPGPSAPNTDLNTPLQMGMRIDGAPARIGVLEHHTQVMGMTGSGKSLSFTWNMVAELITRYSKAGRTEVWGIDVSKHKQTFGVLEQALDRVAYTKEDAQSLILDLIDDIPQRTAKLQEEGFQRWSPRSSLRFRVVIFEEAPDIFEMMEEDMGIETQKMGRLWAVARSAGIHLVSSLQIAIQPDQPKNLKRAMSNKVCFGLESSEDADYGLPDEVLRNGADPGRWQNFNKGMCYMAVEAMDRGRWHMPVRMYKIEEEDIKAHCAKYAAPGKGDENTIEEFDPDSTTTVELNYDDYDFKIDDEKDGLAIEDPIEDDEEDKDDGVDINSPMEDGWDDFELPEVKEPEPSFYDKAFMQLSGWKSKGKKRFKLNELVESCGPASKQSAWNALKRLSSSGYVTNPSWGLYQIEDAILEDK